MDRRVIAFTLALIAAIAVPLCASSGWARGLGVLGLGGGAAEPIPAYTTAVSSYWDGSGEVDTGGTGVSMPWFSEVDASTKGTVTGGQYVVTAAANGQAAYLREMITARADWSAKIDITLSSTTGFGNSSYFEIITAAATLRFTSTSGGVIDNIKLSYQNGAGSWVYSSEYQPTFDTSPHTYEIRFKHSTDTTTTDGEMSVLIDGVTVIGPTAINTTARDSSTNIYAGTKLNVGGMGSNSMSFDNFIFGYK